jgi:16S rRNA (guanine(1405)-N(7))-methyltransferase
VGAYLNQRIHGERWLAALREAAQTDARAEVQIQVRADGVREDAALRAACLRILDNHASSRERLPLLDGFYAQIFGGCDPAAPLTVLDLACGLNPLALPWMGLPRGSRLIACDVHGEMTDFLAQALPLLEPATGVHAQALRWNLLNGVPPVDAEVALLLKTLPCLEQLEAELPGRLLESVRAPLLIVSFPVRSLGGRAKGMEATYSARFEALAADLAWRAERLDVRGELVYRLHRPPE